MKHKSIQTDEYVRIHNDLYLFWSLRSKSVAFNFTTSGKACIIPIQKKKKKKKRKKK
ncbi:hypothetical protein HanRHA438_Chr08g0363271 [Helianthus annuus]|nr:hypothetical protein HanRHA438_Chr08g0363271 [Helianthus annuus]